MSLYLKSQKGFGNKVLDLLSAVYLKRRYDVPVYLVMDDKTFQIIFDKASKLVKYITFDQYPKAKILYLDSFDKLPEKVTEPLTIIGLERYIPNFYYDIDEKDINLLQVNPNSVDKAIVKAAKSTYACVNIRYDKNLCAALNSDIKTNVMLYHPNYYKDMLEVLLNKEEIEAVYIITEAKELVKKYILDESEIANDPRIIFADYPPVDLFYLMTNAEYLVLSHNIFGFAAAYLNTKATIYFAVPDGEAENNDRSGWELVANTKYILTPDLEITKELAYDYGDCDKYVPKISRMSKGSRPRMYPKAYFMVNPVTIIRESRDDLSHYGPLSISNLIIHRTLSVEGALKFYNILVKGRMRVKGTMYGSKGTITDLTLLGEGHLEACLINDCLSNGSIVAQNSIFKGESVFIGNYFFNHCSLYRVQILSQRTDFVNSVIDDCIILNNTEPILIRFVNCKINRLVAGNFVTVHVDTLSKIKATHNVNVIIDT